MIKNLIKNYQNTNVDLYDFFFNISVVKIHKIRFILNLKLKMVNRAATFTNFIQTSFNYGSFYIIS